MARILAFLKDSTEREGLALVLEFARHRCATAGSLQEAVKLMRNQDFDLVVADSTLGDSGSEQIVRILKAISPGVAVMVLAESADFLSAADEVLILPCAPEHLFQRIRYVLGNLPTVRDPSKKAEVRPGSFFLREKLRRARTSA